MNLIYIVFINLQGGCEIEESIVEMRPLLVKYGIVNYCKACIRIISTRKVLFYNKMFYMTVLVFCDNLYCYTPSNREFPTQDTVAKVKIVSC